MQSTGIVRKVDELGRLVIPMDLRRTMGIAEKDAMEIFVDGDRIIFRKYAPGCSLCGIVDVPLTRLFPQDKLICGGCIKSINSLARQ